MAWIVGGVGGAVGFVLTGVGFTGLSVVEVLEAGEVRDAKRFARSAEPVLGSDRLEIAEELADFGAWAVAGLAMSFVGMRWDLRLLRHAVRMSQARAAVPEILAKIPDQDVLTGIRDLSPRDQADLFAVMHESRARAKARRPLTPVQERVSRLETQLYEEIAFETSLQATRLRPDRSRTFGGNSVKPKHMHPGHPKPGDLGAPTELPAPDGLLRVAEDGTRTLTREALYLGTTAGKGAFATVYRELDQFGEPTGWVVKYITEVPRVYHGVPYLAGGSAEQVLVRMRHGYDLLKKAGIETPDAEFFLDPRRNAVVVRQVNVDQEGIRLLRIGDVLNEAEKGAYLGLCRRMVDEDLAFLDGAFRNIYLRTLDDGRTIAGVLDTDFIFKWGDPPDGYAAAMLAKFDIGTLPNANWGVRSLPDLTAVPGLGMGRVSLPFHPQRLTSARLVMEANFEYHHLIYFDRKLKTFQPHPIWPDSSFTVGEIQAGGFPEFGTRTW